MAEAAAKKEQHAKGESGTGNPKKTDVIGLVLLLLVIVNLGGLVTLGLFLQKTWTKMQDLQAQMQKAPEKETTETEAPLGKELQPQNLGVLYPMDSFLVNINSDSGTKFLQLQMEFELSDPALEDEVSRKKPALRDAVIVLLSSRTFKQLREPNGMKHLREDLVKSLNNLLSTGKIKDVFFTQFHFN